MACTSLVALPRVCADGIVGGLEKVYVIAFKDLKAVASGSTDVYSASTSTGTIVQVGLVSGKTFVEIGLLKNTSGLNEKLTKDLTKGTAFFTQTFTLLLSDLTTANNDFIKAVTNQPVAVILKTRTGKYFVAGLNGLLEVSAIDGGTGTAEGDMAGHTLTFEGISLGVVPLIDSTIISGLIS